MEKRPTHRDSRALTTCADQCAGRGAKLVLVDRWIRANGLRGCQCRKEASSINLDNLASR